MNKTMNRAKRPDKLHDREIVSISMDEKEKKLTLGLNKKQTITFENMEYFELSSFQSQNVIFELNVYSPENLPAYISNEYKWLKNYLNEPTFRFCVIDASVGMDGIIVYKV